VPRKELTEDEAVGVVAHQRRRGAAATRRSRSCASGGASARFLHRCPPCEREERESCEREREIRMEQEIRTREETCEREKTNEWLWFNERGRIF
jgi:hypothetical protein